MTDSAVDKLIQGYQQFRDDKFQTQRPLIEDLTTNGQKPQIAVVSCSDSRVDPALLFQTDPGDLFMIRNVANMVPSEDQTGEYHGTMAALEFAVLGLGVKHILVMGHAQCGGINLMMQPDPFDGPFKYVPAWVSKFKAAHQRVQASQPNLSDSESARACEQQSILLSLENLMTYSWVSERINQDQLCLHGWYIDIGKPELSAYDQEAGKFLTLE
ncbi:MAG: carbonic anhydrase [Pseudomonadota bacterium]